MKKIIFTIAFLASVLIGCQKNQPKTEVKELEKITSPSLSNMASDESLDFVKNALKAKLSEGNDPAGRAIDKFIAMVEDYNQSVGKENLIAGFENKLQVQYDVGKLVENREKAEKKFPDTNCRINTHLLAYDNMKVQKAGDPDEELLFMDEEKIKEGKIFDQDEFETFKKFYSRVPTKESKDAGVHGKVMEEYFKDWSFPEKADLISVMINDNLDGDYLFIGHIGLLVEIDGGYLFVEKISFEEPYQAIKFPDKKACYDYLKEKFKDYTDPAVAPPFIMDNGKFVG